MAIDLSSELLEYLADRGCQPNERLPSIQQLAQELGISTGKLREQLEVARSMGLVEVRPKTGMRTTGYQFAPGLVQSLRFALALSPDYFDQFGELRNRVEASFWHEAVRALTAQDLRELNELIERAWDKLQGDPVQIPHTEHRELHLKIFSRLENPFVRGILEAYWDAYEAVGLNVYADYHYLETVWRYHENMVAAIEEGDVEAGYRALVDHISLLDDRPELAPVGQRAVDRLVGSP